MATMKGKIKFDLTDEELASIRNTKHWGMFSAQGDKLVGRAVESVLTDGFEVTRSNADDEGPWWDFFEAVESLLTEQGHDEVSDTAVREQVWAVTQRFFR